MRGRRGMAAGSIVKNMTVMMGKVAKTAGKGAIGVCDAYFFNKTMLETAALFLDKNGKQMLYIITRAKKNPHWWLRNRWFPVNITKTTEVWSVSLHFPHCWPSGVLLISYIGWLEHLPLSRS
jgi:hypothetical protein